ncbi:MAG: MoaD/ThiS family protein [Paracoccaceae bacterium]
MAKVRETITVELFASLASHAGGARSVEVEASNLREMFDALKAQFPGMTPALERGVSVSIDGRIYTESLFQPVGADNEIVLIAQLRGG